ncbi:MAG: leucine-rich repeat domain-containing protein [Victivallaceae bacterium]
MFETPYLKPRTLKIMAAGAIIVAVSGLCVRLGVVNLRTLFNLAPTMNRELSAQLTQSNPNADQLPSRVDDRSTTEQQRLSVYLPPEVKDADLSVVLATLDNQREVYLDVSCANLDFGQLADYKINSLGVHRNGEGHFSFKRANDLQIENLVMANWSEDDYKIIPEIPSVKRLFLAAGEVNLAQWPLLNAFPNLEMASFHAFEVGTTELPLEIPIKELRFYNCKLSGGFPALRHPEAVKTLSLAGAQLEDWSKLSELKNLENLDLSNSNFHDIELLNNLPKLKNLYLINTQASDFESLKERKFDNFQYQLN